MIQRECPMCNGALEALDADAMGDLMIEHVAEVHPELPYPREAIWNFGADLARLTGSTERLEEIGEVEVHPVTEERLSDWLHLFDHDVFAGMPQWSACYCTEPHFLQPDDPNGESNRGTWREKRERMVERFRAGEVFGYLAYVDGRPAGWVNASMRCDYSPLFRRGTDDDATTVGVTCFAIAPPYRGHGVRDALLARVVADAPARGASAVEAYPLNQQSENPAFRGTASLYEREGFTPVKVRAHDTVVRREVSPGG